MSGNISEHEARRRLEELDPAYEIGSLYARTERATINPEGKPETDGEHVITLNMICVAYASKYRPELDPYKLTFYNVFHDIDEWLFGDVPSLGITAEGYLEKDAKEQLAREERERRMASFPEFNALLGTLNDLSTPEYAFAKAFDKLAPSFTHIDNGGKVLKDFYKYSTIEEVIEGNRSVFEKMEKYAAEFEDVLAMKQATIQRIADAAFNGIKVETE